MALTAFTPLYWKNSGIFPKKFDPGLYNQKVEQSKKDYENCHKLPHAMDKLTTSPTATPVTGQTKEFRLFPEIKVTTKIVLAGIISFDIVENQLVHHCKPIERTNHSCGIKRYLEYKS